MSSPSATRGPTPYRCANCAVYFFLEDFHPELGRCVECEKARAVRFDPKPSSAERRIDPRYAGADPAAEYEKRNPLGGPAKVFEAMAARIRAGDEYQSVLDDYGFQIKDPSRRGTTSAVQNDENGIVTSESATSVVGMTPSTVKVSSALRDLAERCRPAVRAYVTKSDMAETFGKYPDHYKPVLKSEAEKAHALLDEIDAILAGTQPSTVMAPSLKTVRDYLIEIMDSARNALQRDSSPGNAQLNVGCLSRIEMNAVDALKDIDALPSSIEPSTRVLLHDVRYEIRRVLMGAPWERSHFIRLIERMDEVLKAHESATKASSK